MSHRVEAAPDEEEVVEVDSDNEGTIDLGSEDGDEENSLPTLPAAGSNLPEEEEVEEEDEVEEEEDDDELALTNRQLNEQFVYHITSPTPFPNYSSPSPHLPLSNRPNDTSTILNRNDPSAPQNTTMHDNAEQPGNQQSTQTGKFSFN